MDAAAVESALLGDDPCCCCCCCCWDWAPDIMAAEAVADAVEGVVMEGAAIGNCLLDPGLGISVESATLDDDDDDMIGGISRCWGEAYGWY